MLDNKMTLFHVQLANKSVKNKALVLAGCAAYLHANKIVYSELDELNFSDINRNDYGLGFMDVEFYFEDSFDDPYFKFCTRCFSIRTDNGVRIKLNGYPDNQYYSKVNKNNKVVVGIRYYFQLEEEIKYFESCNTFCIEGFIAIGKKKNVYGIMCRLNKMEDQWSVIDCNTYKIYNNRNITSLYH